MNHKETIRVVRGMQYDGIGNPWIRSNFTFEVYVESAFLLMDIYVPFNGKNEFAYWGSFTGEKESEDIAITEFRWSGEVVGGEYTNGLTLYILS